MPTPTSQNRRPPTEHIPAAVRSLTIGADRKTLAERLVPFRKAGVALVLLALSLVAVVRLVGPPSTAAITSLGPESLEVGERARGTYQVGNHTILIASDGMTVSHPRSPGAVWASPRNRAFLVAGHGESMLRERLGMLRVSDHVEQGFNHQTIDGADIDSEGRLVVSGRLADEAEGEAVDYQLFMSVRLFRGEQLHLEARVLSEEVNRVTLWSEREPGEQVHGLGEQFAPFDLTGRVYPLLPREQGIGRGEQPLSLAVDLVAGAAGSRDTTYAPLPVYVTSVPRSVWALGTEPLVADVRPQGRIGMTAWADELVVEFGVGATPAAHVAGHAQATGLMHRPPAWVGEGLVAGLQGGTEEVRAELAALRDAGVAVSAVWIQDWVGQRSTSFGDRLWWNWTLDTQRYPDFEAFVEELAGQDIRVLGYANPRLSPQAGDRADRDLYAEAAEAGHLVLGGEGTPYLEDQGDFQAAWVDLFDADAREWLVDVLVDEMLALGFSGFMADFGEGPPVDAITSAGPGIDVRRAYADLWVATAHEALAEAGLGADGLAFHRSAGPDSAGQASMFWAGDQLVTFSDADGLGSVLDGLLSGGVSGMAINHFDIGGYTSLALPGPLPDLTRSAELFMRSAELAVFTGMMRTHEGNRPDLGVQAIDPVVVDHLADMVELYVALAPERRRLLVDATISGLPIVRHPILVVPEQPEVAYQDDVFFMGSDVLVAPVLGGGVEVRLVTLPAGRWTDIWTGEVIEVARNVVGEMTVEVPLGRPAAWTRAGSLVDRDLNRWRAEG